MSVCKVCKPPYHHAEVTMIPIYNRVYDIITQTRTLQISAKSICMGIVASHLGSTQNMGLPYYHVIVQNTWISSNCLPVEIKSYTGDINSLTNHVNSANLDTQIYLKRFCFQQFFGYWYLDCSSAQNFHLGTRPGEIGKISQTISAKVNILVYTYNLLGVHLQVKRESVLGISHNSLRRSHKNPVLHIMCLYSALEYLLTQLLSSFCSLSEHQPVKWLPHLQLDSLARLSANRLEGWCIELGYYALEQSASKHCMAFTYPQ